MKSPRAHIALRNLLQATLLAAVVILCAASPAHADDGSESGDGPKIVANQPNDPCSETLEGVRVVGNVFYAEGVFGKRPIPFSDSASGGANVVRLSDEARSAEKLGEQGAETNYQLWRFLTENPSILYAEFRDSEYRLVGRDPIVEYLEGLLNVIRMSGQNQSARNDPPELVQRLYYSVTTVDMIAEYGLLMQLSEKFETEKAMNLMNEIRQDTYRAQYFNIHRQKEVPLAPAEGDVELKPLDDKAKKRLEELMASLVVLRGSLFDWKDIMQKNRIKAVRMIRYDSKIKHLLTEIEMNLELVVQTLEEARLASDVTLRDFSFVRDRILPQIEDMFSMEAYGDLTSMGEGRVSMHKAQVDRINELSRLYYAWSLAFEDIPTETSLRPPADFGG